MSKRLTIEEFIKTLKSGGSGSGGGALTVNCTHDSDDNCLRLDKTWKEIDDALRSGQIVIVLVEVEPGTTTAGAYLATTSQELLDVDNLPPYCCLVHGMGYTANGNVPFEATSEDNYPTYSISN